MITLVTNSPKALILPIWVILLAVVGMFWEPPHSMEQMALFIFYFPIHQPCPSTTPATTPATPITSTTLATNSTRSPSNATNLGAIIGGVIGGAALVAAGVTLVFLRVMKKGPFAEGTRAPERHVKANAFFTDL